VITKSKEHETNQAGKRLLRKALEPLNCVVNDVQEDYGIDCNVQVFHGTAPTGSWFHVQLKSSLSSDYSADRTFVSQELSVDHARHYAFELRQPIFLIHVDVTSESVYWHAPQLDERLATVLRNTKAKFITVRIPTRQQLPATAPELFANLDNIRLALATRELMSASTESFVETLKHMPNQEELLREFQRKNDTLKLHNTNFLFKQKRFDEARTRLNAILVNPDSTTETKFWAEIQCEGIDFTETIHSGKPQIELSKVFLAHAKSLQKLTVSGPNYLKFYAMIARHAAELESLTHQYFTVFLARTQHLEPQGNPVMVMRFFARRSELIRMILLKYNQCIRLARYASTYSDRWMLGRALARIAQAIGPYLICLRAESRFEAEVAFSRSALEICKLAAWIGQETGDPGGVVLALLGALTLTSSARSDAFRWAADVAQNLVDADARADALRLIERALARWQGDTVEGDHRGDTAWQVIQNIATAHGVDLSDENNPLVRALRLAAQDNSPEDVLAQCEHLLVSRGAVGPIARQIQMQFNIGSAGSKVIHCTLHNFHVEGKDQGTAYAEFKKLHCDSCPDRKPRPEGWKLTKEVLRAIEDRNRPYVATLAGTPFGVRYTDKD
jgi:hypothetical protein